MSRSAYRIHVITLLTKRTSKDEDYFLKSRERSEILGAGMRVCSTTAITLRHHGNQQLAYD